MLRERISVACIVLFAFVLTSPGSVSVGESVNESEKGVETEEVMFDLDEELTWDLFAENNWTFVNSDRSYFSIDYFDGRECLKAYQTGGYLPPYAVGNWTSSEVFEDFFLFTCRMWLPHNDDHSDAPKGFYGQSFYINVYDTDNVLGIMTRVVMDRPGDTTPTIPVGWTWRDQTWWHPIAGFDKGWGTFTIRLDRGAPTWTGIWDYPDGTQVVRTDCGFYNGDSVDFEIGRIELVNALSEETADVIYIDTMYAAQGSGPNGWKKGPQHDTEEVMFDLDEELTWDLFAENNWTFVNSDRSFFSIDYFDGRECLKAYQTGGYLPPYAVGNWTASEAFQDYFLFTCRMWLPHNDNHSDAPKGIYGQSLYINVYDTNNVLRIMTRVVMDRPGDTVPTIPVGWTWRDQTWWHPIAGFDKGWGTFTIRLDRGAPTWTGIWDYPDGTQVVRTDCGFFNGDSIDFEIGRIELVNALSEETADVIYIDTMYAAQDSGPNGGSNDPY
jgi:hypothetical protein